MAVNIDILIVVVVVTMTFALLRWLEQKFGRKLSETEYERKVAELEERVKWLLDELQAAKVRIRELEKGQAVAQRNGTMPTKPLLFICGSDQRLCEVDRQSIRQTEIPYTRLFSATQKQIDAELNRRRQDGNMYRWVHIAAHASEAGIELADGLAPPSFWNNVLVGVDVLCLPNCRTAEIADALAGMMTVVYVLEDIDNVVASRFTYAFWRRMREHGDPERAYRQALDAVPAVSEYTDIRKS